MSWIRAVVMALLAVLGTVVAPANAVGDSVVKRTDVCFTVHNLGEPAPQQVSGTLFHVGKYSAGATALLLVHGAATARHSWDGGRPYVKGVPSVAARLASAGYAVFAIDRLGYGRSPYPGSGYTLTPDSYVEQTHEMVTQIREGSYRINARRADCSGGVPHNLPAAKVALIGFSSGARIIEGYATRYQDIDGIVGMMHSNQGASDAFLEYYLAEAVPRFAQGDYVQLFSTRQPCEDFLFFRPGISSSARKQFCGPSYYLHPEIGKTPTGELIGALWFDIATSALIGRVGPTPVLLVFADNDRIFTDADSGDTDVTTPEINMWRTSCDCDFKYYVQRDAGHAGWFHRTAPAATDRIIRWLRAKGL